MDPAWLHLSDGHDHGSAQRSVRFPKISIFNAEIRRRLWFTILDMDIDISMACNLPTVVREGEYSCQPPKNIDDEQLSPETKELLWPKPLDQPTTNQLQAYSASALPWRMKVTSLISRLDSVRDYAEVLEIGGKIESVLDDINCLFPRQFSPDPAQRCLDWRIRFSLDSHVRRSLLALYRPFRPKHQQLPAADPDQLPQILYGHAQLPRRAGPANPAYARDHALA